MWDSTIFHCPSPKERLVLELTGIREHGRAQAAEQIVPLKDTGSSVPREMALQDELENRSSQVRCAERKLQHKELESQEQMTYIRQEYEIKLKGLMPASLRQELEDTISSLKSQVNFLQKRASILQEELTTYQGRR
ncbi:centrosomal protein of 112 kDa isoform 12-T13 [Thomomys bottae]